MGRTNPDRGTASAARQPPSPVAGPGGAGKVYRPPVLASYGVLLDLTLGGSPGAGDSGGGALIQNPLG